VRLDHFLLIFDRFRHPNGDDCLLSSSFIDRVAKSLTETFGSSEGEKRGFPFPHGSMILETIIDPGAFPRRDDP